MSDEDLLGDDADEVDALGALDDEFGDGEDETELDADEDDGFGTTTGGFDDDEEDGEDRVAPDLDAVGDGDDAEPSSEPAVDIALLEGLADDDEVVAEPDDAEDAIADSEFVCRSCHMAKRASALADADAMLCRDCV